MKNPITLLVVVAVLAAVGFGAYTLLQKSSQSDSMMKKEEAMMVKEDESMMGDKMASSQYVSYSKEALNGASNNRRVLFFYASWCPTCRPADAIFTQNVSKIPEDVTLIRVNYNDPETDQEEKGLADKYGITYQHTFVQIDSNGREVTKWNGGQIDELLTNIK